MKPTVIFAMEQVGVLRAIVELLPALVLIIRVLTVRHIRVNVLLVMAQAK